MTLEELRQQASQLPEDERGSLVADLLATFGSANYDVSDQEVTRRVAETEAGEVDDISFEELKAGIEAQSSK